MISEPNLIIIADDDSDDCLFLSSVLLSMPLELSVIIVPNGERLINMLKAVSPQFIFLDINMPRKSGFEVLRQIRSNKNAPQPTIIMCSTSNSSIDLRMSQELGADLYIVKPNSINQLTTMVDEIFKRDWAGTTDKRIPASFLLSHVQ